jgi:hypothetical protein
MGNERKMLIFHHNLRSCREQKEIAEPFPSAKGPRHMLAICTGEKTCKDL